MNVRTRKVFVSEHSLLQNLVIHVGDVLYEPVQCTYTEGIHWKTRLVAGSRSISAARLQPSPLLFSSWNQTHSGPRHKKTHQQLPTTEDVDTTHDLCAQNKDK